MNRPDRSTIVRVAVTVAVVAGGLVVVREVLTCDPPRDQANMIEVFEADPLVAAAPADSQLVDEHSRTYACDSGLPHGGSPTGPGFAEVRRQYQTPVAYRLDQLRRSFDEPAAAGGWRLLLDRPDDPATGGGAAIIYCKQAGGRAAVAYVTSSINAWYEAPSRTEGTGTAPSRVDVRLSADPDRGTDCDHKLRELGPRWTLDQPRTASPPARTPHDR